MKYNKQTGFTLIEILVVMVILGVLAGLVAPALLGQAGQARIDAAKTDLTTIAKSLDIYKLDNFQYPSTDQGLEALVTKPSGSPEPKNYKSSGYVKKLPIDPWGNPYQYINEGSDYEIYSMGADGQEGGEEDNADISSKDD
jgi:general secretion pathway protein G